MVLKRVHRSNQFQFSFLINKQIKSKTDCSKVWAFLNKDAEELARIKHPNILSLAAQPLEDNKTLVFITEQVEYSLADLFNNSKSKTQLLPGELESKLIMLELMEAVHFLHNTAKLAHLSISPENIYITKEGKVKLGGFSCCAELKESSNPVDFSFSTFLDGKLAWAPNLRFTAPEVVSNNSASASADIFSMACLLHFLLNMDKGNDAYVLNLKSEFSTQLHVRALEDLKKDMHSKFINWPYALKTLMTSWLDSDKSNRGSVNSMVENGFFQDPLIKTIRYLETIEHKEHHNVVQFLTGLSRILDKFDKRSCIKKVLPLMLRCLDRGDLSVLILPPLIKLIRQDDFIDKESFLEHVWPPLK